LKINTKKYIIAMAEARSNETEPLLQEHQKGDDEDDDDVADPPLAAMYLWGSTLENL